MVTGHINLFQNRLTPYLRNECCYSTAFLPSNNLPMCLLFQKLEKKFDVIPKISKIQIFVRDVFTTWYGGKYIVFSRAKFHFLIMTLHNLQLKLTCSRIIIHWVLFIDKLCFCHIIATKVKIYILFLSFCEKF